MFSFSMIQEHNSSFIERLEQALHQLVLDCMFMDSVEDVQRFLVEAGCDKLRLNSAEP